MLQATLKAANHGDQQAWRQLIEQYSGRVFGLVYRQCGNAELSEEIAQATFVKVVSKLGDYQAQGRFEAWLFRIALNLLRDEMRRRKRQASPTDFAETPPEALGARNPGELDDSPLAPLHQAETNEKLHQAIARLGEADRQIIHLRYVAELTYPQIAESLDQPLGTVLARGHRALKKLKDMLGVLDGAI